MIFDEHFLGEFCQLSLAGGRNVAIDIGANAGEWTRWMAIEFDHVVACEPDSRAIGFHKALGVPHNALLLPLAVGREPGAQNFYLREDIRQSSLQEEHPIGGADQKPVRSIAQETVGVTTLDLLVDICHLIYPFQPIDLIKIDVEGSEADVLAGVAKWRDRFAPTRWIIEVHDTAEAVGSELERLGYTDLRVMKHPYQGAHPGHLWIFVPAREPNE